MTRPMHLPPLRTIGVCRYCGCTETNVCLDADAHPCRWADAEQTLCSHCQARGGPPRQLPRSPDEWSRRLALVIAMQSSGLTLDATALMAVGLIDEPSPEIDEFLVMLALDEFVARAEALGYHVRPGHRGRVVAEGPP